MADAARKRMILSEFYAWNPPGDTRYELIDGVPVAMPLTGAPHGCEVFRRGADGRWIVDLLTERDARLVLDSVGLDVPLLDLYVNLPAAESA
jgi:Uma2 family endonuclease